MSVCGCRCHGGEPGWLCCPECEPSAYDVCDRCSAHRYQHNDEEREGSPGACATFVEWVECPACAILWRVHTSNMKSECRKAITSP